MALSASLLLRQTQSLVMTPQLMQSIQLLQMTYIELNQFIAAEVEKNPLLELSSADGSSDYEGQGREDGDGRGERQDGESDADRQRPSQTERLTEALGGGFDNVYQDDAGPRKADAPELLSQWKSMPGSLGESGEAYDLDDFVAGQITLKDHVAQQVPFLLHDPIESLVARHLTDLLDDCGYVHHGLDEVAATLGKKPAEVAAVLEKLQTLDPPGIFARSLGECLALQLKARDRFDPAMEALVANLDLLARRDFQSLKKICGVDEEDLLDMLAEIRTLDPKPGNGFETSGTETVVPDVIVLPAPDGGWTVELNPETLPRVLVNQDYYQRVSGPSARNDGDKAFLAECLQNASWLTRSLDQRARTIMKVATEIVRQQDAFLALGIDHLRPLNLKTIADAIKMHESTVSRVTSNKYMLTPRGLFELKYFFTVSIAAVEGGEAHSAEAVRHRIRMMIQEERQDGVLSDDDIVDALKAGGIDLARRTVAKYREAMNIPSSVQRRREKRAQASVGTA
ncbi:MAG: RNA polymerase factor sigma-54 [Rhizobium sp.]|nr:RNA polymerase factor sigma-54 [Rhizobium sp.]